MDVKIPVVAISHRVVCGCITLQLAHYFFRFLKRFPFHGNTKVNHFKNHPFILQLLFYVMNETLHIVEIVSTNKLNRYLAN